MTSGAEHGGRPGHKHKSPQPELTALGRYQIEKKLGAGGMGMVYRAVDTQLKRTVALKVLPKEKAENELLVKRFRSEAQAAASLKHENIIGVYDSGQVDGLLYIAMEYVEGIDVHELVQRKGPLEPRRAADIIRQVTLALQHAFEQGIVHRDIKPANLMIMRDGSVKLADMGLARSISDTEEAGITRAGTTVGTVDYMSPEQARDSKSADSRSDIYSLGATWYQMLTGQPPYPGGDLLNKINAHAFDPIPDPREFNKDIPEGTVEIIQQMLAKKPEDRYQTPAELLDDLKNAGRKRRGITVDLLAALADGESDQAATAEEEEEASVAPARRRRPARNDDPLDRMRVPLSDSDVDVPASRGRDVPHAERETSGGSRPASGDRAGEPASRQSDTRQRDSRTSRSPQRREKPAKRSRSQRDTSHDHADTGQSIPSARDVMLRRGVRRGGRGGGVSFNPVRLIPVAVILAALFVGYQMVMSALNRTAEPPSGTTSPQIEPSGTGSGSGPTSSPPRSSTGSPPRRTGG